MTILTQTAALDPFDPEQVRRSTGLLSDLNQAGVLTAADVHVAQRLGAMTGEDNENVLVAAALTIRSTRLGSVLVDLAEVQSIDGLAGFAAPADWVRRCAASPLMRGPLQQEGSRVWLHRYWGQERYVAADLIERLTASAETGPGLDEAMLRAGLGRLFPDPNDADQRAAAELSARHRMSVLAGGPGTGKTTTVARLLALLKEQQPQCRIALAAPTGKAAARLAEAVRHATGRLLAEDQDRLGVLDATTVHRLLGWRADARSRFRHDRDNRLPHDIVVVDESSMLSLTLMARLLEALRPAARLILVGDPDQLASVEAGAVLADLTEPGSRTPVSRLTVNRRFGDSGPIVDLASAVRAGDSGAALAVLRAGHPSVELVEADDDDAVPPGSELSGVQQDVRDAGTELTRAALDGDAAGAIAALERHRVLCAHRHGPRGVDIWGELVGDWVAAATGSGPSRTPRGNGDVRPDGRYLGEPLLVTVNDYDTGLYNGDTGVVIAGENDRLIAVFGRGGDPIQVELDRLGHIATMHAMTVHRSQGSQFARVTVVLPPAESRLGTRQTLYTAITRAERHVRIIGSVAAFTTAIERPALRATGLADRLA